MIHTARSTICPACGFDLGFEPWSDVSASDEICPSCGIQFGYDDAAPGGETAREAIYRAWRKRWIEEGMEWWSTNERPEDWDPNAQIERVWDRGSS